MVLDLIGAQVIPCPRGTLCVPSRPHEGIVWDSSSGSTGALKVVLDRKVVLPVSMRRALTHSPDRFLKLSSLRSVPVLPMRMEIPW